MVADAAAGLAEVRRANGDETFREWSYYGPEILRIGTMGSIMSAGFSVASFAAGNVGAAGESYGAITKYLTGEMELTMRTSALVRQQRELNGAVALSQAEQQRAVLGVELARLQRVQAAATLAYAESNLEFATAKALSADFWFAAAKRTREFAQRYLDTAIRMAFLTEQAFEFAAGRRIDRIKFDYASSDNHLAAEALLADLDSIEAERIFSSEETEVPVRYVIPLRIRDLPSFETLKRTGTIRVRHDDCRARSRASGDLFPPPPGRGGRGPRPHHADGDPRDTDQGRALLAAFPVGRYRVGGERCPGLDHRHPHPLPARPPRAGGAQPSPVELRHTPRQRRPARGQRKPARAPGGGRLRLDVDADVRSQPPTTSTSPP